LKKSVLRVSSKMVTHKRGNEVGKKTKKLNRRKM